MKYTFVALVLACFLASTLAIKPAKAASKSDGSVQLQTTDKAKDEVKNGKDKPKRSKKNDDKDEDPDDGNSGGGNDGKDKDKKDK